jgi:hypothetical protein
MDHTVAGNLGYCTSESLVRDGMPVVCTFVLRYCTGQHIRFQCIYGRRPSRDLLLPREISKQTQRR